MGLTDKERDDLRKAAEARNCTTYLLLPLRTYAQAKKDTANESR